MNLLLENVNLNSKSGPNHFAQKLSKYLNYRGVTFDSSRPYDKKLTFIQSIGIRQDLKMILRLDGIYFNAGFDCEKMNYNIKKSYENASGVVFQTEFNKNLIFKWFGEHSNYQIINNGADLLTTKEIVLDQEIVKKFKKFDKVWSCAANWHSFKRLEANIRYFLEFSNENDCLIVAGNNPDYFIDNPKIFYVGDLPTHKLYTVYKITDYFIHLAYLDHCPNVVIDARSCGAKIICSSSGGTKEIAGKDAVIIQETEWDYTFIKEKIPPKIYFDNILSSGIESDVSMVKVAKKYHKFLMSVK
jgi:glycosyltransferase involved in cell wall biosynthesis